MLEVQPTSLPGVLLLQPRTFGDSRGYFFETYRQTYTDVGVATMVQANVSRSKVGVIRGLHFQREHAQAKLVSVIRGSIFDVAVDLRPGSSTFGRWFGQQLNDQNHLMMYIPTGFAHGFCVLSEADVLYQCSDYYHPGSEVGVLWNDPELGIEWPLQEGILSEKDAQNPRLSELSPDQLPLA